MTPSWAGRPTEVLLVLALTVAALLPFLDKPFHIDDPLFLWSAQQITRDPFDFYGAPVNWLGVEQPLHTVTKNPPLTSYAIAAVSRFAGSGERALHAAFVVPTAAAVLGTGVVAARLGAPPTLAALVLLASPGFLTSATSVMCDVPMLAFFVWALFFWIRGLETRRTGSLFLAGVLVAAAALTKYFGAALLPLLTLYAVWRERRAGAWCLALVVPVLVLAAYQWGTHELYGRGLLSDAAEFASVTTAGTRADLVRHVLVALAFTGACAAPLLLFLPGLVPSRRWLAAAAAAALTLAIVLPRLGSLGAGPDGLDRSLGWGFAAQFALHAVVGVAALALALADFARRRSADATLLLAWVSGTFVFTAFVNWTINARSILPLMPALAILIGRRLAERGAGRLAQFLPLVPAAALAFEVALADQSLAESGKHVAGTARRSYAERRGTVWFLGHWGFQYYMQAYGFRPMDLVDASLARGDLVVSPAGNYGVFPLPAGHARLLASFSEPARLVTVMDAQAGAGFYSNVWGPLPYAFGGASPGVHTVYEMTKPLELVPRPAEAEP